MAEIQIQFTSESHLHAFWEALDSVARERQYLLMLQGPELESTRAFLTKLLAQGWTQFLALDGKKVAGWCDITPFERDGLRHASRLGIAVVREYRRRGLGEKLMRAALADAFAKGILRVELEVFAANAPAIALYEKLGFRHEGRRRKARYLDLQFDDILTMGLLREEATEIGI